MVSWDRVVAWDEDDAKAIGDSHEIEIATSDSAGDPERPVVIWVVRVDRSLYVRSWRGTQGRWFRRAQARPYARISAAQRVRAVGLMPAPAATVDSVDAAYLAKYASSEYCAAMVTPAAAATTMLLVPLVDSIDASTTDA